ncbi:MAG: hypothetical protein LH473_04300 [Chitinophagales bacterium]|nr:hypothetical protein [Chitinophagales bacterium]
MINLINYEEYFFRAAEGDLSKAEEAELFLFIKNHPLLQAELDAFKSTVLVPDELVVFTKKNELKKAEIDYNELLVRYVENDLNALEADQVNKLVAANSSLKKEFDLYMATVFVADESIVFPDKNSLKKQEVRIIPIYIRIASVAAIAASLLIVIYLGGLNFINLTNVPSTAEVQITDTNNVVIPKQQASNSIASNNSNSIVARVDSQNVRAKSFSATDKKVIKHHKQNRLVASTVPGVKNNDVLDLTFNEGEINKLSTEGMNYINFQPRVRKAKYIEKYDQVFEAVAEHSNSKEIKSVAAQIGSELLKLSGRGSYLNSANAFNSNKKKLPVNLSITGEKFNFSHKFFKNRSKNLNDFKK